MWNDISCRGFVKTLYVRYKLTHYTLENECKVLAGILCPVTGTCSADFDTLRAI